MTIEEKMARLRAHGYKLYHLFGGWYLGRVWSVNCKLKRGRIPLYWFYHFTES